MVGILKFFGYVFFFFGALLYFFPKISLYYYAEKELQKHQLVISKEELKENSFSLTLNNASVSYDAVESVKVQEIDISVFALYNSVSLADLNVSELGASFIPTKIEKVEVTHSIFSPFYLYISGDGEFGTAKAQLHILDKNLTLHLEPSKLMLDRYSSALRRMKKNEDGSYKYEKTF